MKKLSNILLLLLLLPAILFANEPKEGKFTKQKTIAKAYLVNPDAGIDIQNSYGNIYVTTWNEDKIDISVVIKVSGDKEVWVTQKLNDIDVDINALKNLVTAKTKFAKSNGKTANGSIEINYTIRIPKNGSVKLNNKYGNITTTELASGVNVNCKYGRITLGKITGNATVINIEYCNSSSVEAMKNAVVVAKYSKISLGDFTALDLDADYTDVSTGNGGNVSYISNYGKLNFGRVKNLDGKGDYLDVKASEISGNLQVKTQYSKVNVLNVTASAGSFNLDTDYTNVNINYNAGYAFNFDVNVKYADFDYDSDVQIQSKQESSSSKSYRGFYKKNGANKVTVVSNYGNVKLSKD